MIRLAGCITLGILGLGVGSNAQAGANAGGFFLLHTDDTVIYSEDDAGTYCDLLALQCPADPECDDDNSGCVSFLLDDLDPISDRGPKVALIWAVAAFPEAICPRVTALQFGLDWSTDFDLTFEGWGVCGPLEIASDGWPTERGSGTAVAWGTGNPVQRTAFPVYWFAAYSYYGPVEMSIANPPFGPDAEVAFADDAVPAIIDVVPVENRGSVGLNGAMGFNPYVAGEAPGACCLPDGSCLLLTVSGCTGEYLGDHVPCDPNPCELVPTERMSWGEMKSLFRE